MQHRTANPPMSPPPNPLVTLCCRGICGPLHVSPFFRVNLLEIHLEENSVRRKLNHQTQPHPHSTARETLWPTLSHKTSLCVCVCACVHHFMEQNNRSYFPYSKNMITQISLCPLNQWFSNFFFGDPHFQNDKPSRPK